MPWAPDFMALGSMDAARRCRQLARVVLLFAVRPSPRVKMRSVCHVPSVVSNRSGDSVAGAGFRARRRAEVHQYVESARGIDDDLCGKKVAALIMSDDQNLRVAGEEALVRELADLGSPAA